MKNMKVFAGLIGFSAISFCASAQAEDIFSRVGKAVTDAYPELAPKPEITPLRIIAFDGVNYRIYGTDECQNPTGGFYPRSSCVAFPKEANKSPVDRAVQLLVVRPDNPDRSERMTTGVIRLGLGKHGEATVWLKSIGKDGGIIHTFDGDGLPGMSKNG
ncbi:hypothetical protein AA14337_0746 [Acetobacter malorum DSM 14337]|uniref:Uncharacterized protein n=1 Tax=Acetobacter malorum DSM 14337 TaxID=1307910 RepID=A0ABQ0PS20_9PROT|nr:hypothetical protein [Acetobacter malorum]KXV08742.1 hypothetical protein AD930_03800 [Acetobacter malorum]GBQ77196.1 hypothetical protein AA14337_0746 [Acetobacter malorum DSM 14337]